MAIDLKYGIYVTWLSASNNRANSVELTDRHYGVMLFEWLQMRAQLCFVKDFMTDFPTCVMVSESDYHRLLHAISQHNTNLQFAPFAQLIILQSIAFSWRL